MTAKDPCAADVVYYDGACPLCSREIATYRKMDRGEQIEWRDVSGDADLPVGRDRAELLARFHVTREDGQTVSGARAFLAVWRRMPRLRRVAILLDRQPFLAMLDMLYALFLRIRPLWRPSSGARRAP